MHIYETGHGKIIRDLRSDVLPFGRLRYSESNAVANEIGYAMHRSRSHDAVIRLYDAASNVTQTAPTQGGM